MALPKVHGGKWEGTNPSLSPVSLTNWCHCPEVKLQQHAQTMVNKSLSSSRLSQILPDETQM